MNEQLRYYESIAKDSVSHHWVPQCYLKNFSIPEKHGTIFFYQKSGTPTPIGTQGVAAKNNLYTFENKETGKETRAMEGVFAEHEGQVSPILRSIARDRSLPVDGGLETLAVFVSLLVVRGPSFSDWLRNMDIAREEMRIQTLARSPEALKKHLAKIGVSVESEEEFRELRESYLRAKLEIKGGKEHYFKEAMDLGKDMYKVFIAEKSWHLLVANGNRHFITSDNPIVIQRVKEVPLHLAEGFGFGTILLTISPHVCLVLRSIPLTETVIDVSPADVECINRSIIKSARRQVYGHIASKIIQSDCDVLLNGGESTISIENLGRFSPYVITKGNARDIEASVFERYTL